MRYGFARWLWVGMVCTFSVYAAEPIPRHLGPFPIPRAIHPAVRFWIDVFTRYSGNQALIIDEDPPHYILRIVVVEGADPWDFSLRPAVRRTLDEQKVQIRQVLSDLERHGAKAATWSPQHRWIWHLYGDRIRQDPRFLDRLKDRLRIQWGHRERFRQALENMTRYVPHLRSLLRQAGLPEELTCLPLIESGYNPYAVSPAGARGLWQFMRNTARKHGLTVNAYIDQRLDPLYATVGAAQYLKRAYEEFGNWPLAITSYNHGVQGVRRAVQTLKTTDYVTIYRKYRGPYFGYASRNFYPEFIAACLIARHPERYFPSWQPRNPWQFAEYVLPRSMRIRDVLRTIDVPLTLFVQYNPQFTLQAFFANIRLEAGTRIRIPVLPDTATEAAFHVIRPGETLHSIARFYRVSIEQLLDLNPFLDVRRLLPGELIQIHPARREDGVHREAVAGVRGGK